MLRARLRVKFLDDANVEKVKDKQEGVAGTSVCDYKIVKRNGCIKGNGWSLLTLSVYLMAEERNSLSHWHFIIYQFTRGTSFLSICQTR